MIKVKKFSLLLLSIIIIINYNIFSQEKIKKIDLNEAIQIAIENNHSLKIAKLNVEKSEAAVREAFGYALPKFDLSATYSRFLKKVKMPFPDFEALLTNATYSILFKESVIPEDYSKFRDVKNILQSFAQTNNYEAKAEITQILFNSAVFRGIGASQIYLNLAKEQQRSITTNTISDVKKNFYSVILTQEFARILEESFANALENLKNVKALYQQGFASEYDYLQAEVQVENIRPKVTELQNTLNNAKNGFKIVLGIDQSQEIALEGELKYNFEDLPDVETLVNEGLNKNGDINVLKIKLKVDDAMVALDLSDYWPSLVAFGNYSLQGSSDDFKFENYSSSMVGLSFSINLFRGLQTKNKVQQSRINIKQTEEQLAQLKDLIVFQIKSKYESIKRIQEQLIALEKNVKLAEKTYKIANARYQQKTGTQLEVKNADMELRTAKTNTLQAVYDHKIAILEIYQLIGKIDNNYSKFYE